MGQIYRIIEPLVLELHWRRGDVGSKAPPRQAKVKMEVEAREKILGWVARGG